MVPVIRRVVPACQLPTMSVDQDRGRDMGYRTPAGEEDLEFVRRVGLAGCKDKLIS